MEKEYNVSDRLDVSWVLCILTWISEQARLARPGRSLPLQVPYRRPVLPESGPVLERVVPFLHPCYM